MLVLKFENVDGSLQVAQEIARIAAEALPAGPRRLYTALVAAGLEVAREKQYSEKITEVTFFAPAESVALSIGCHVSSLYRWLPVLSALNLVAATGHYCTHNRQTKQDGTVWTVKFRQSDKRARVGFDWLKKSYRCLGADIEVGRTAYQQIRESYPSRGKLGIKPEYILRWALSTPSENPVINDSLISQRVDLETIFDVPAVRKQDRAETIYNAAKTMSAALNDSRSTRFFCAVLWNLCRIRDRAGANYFPALHTMVSRCQADVAEGWALEGNGGKLLVSRLRQANLCPDLLRSPLVRVGTKPN